MTGEFDAFAKHSHPDLLYTHSNAVVDTLDSYLAKCRDGFYDYHSIAHPIDKITVIGDIALVFGEMKADLTAGGTRKQLDNGSLAVWTRDRAHLAAAGLPADRQTSRRPPWLRAPGSAPS